MQNEPAVSATGDVAPKAAKVDVRGDLMELEGRARLPVTDVGDAGVQGDNRTAHDAMCSMPNGCDDVQDASGSVTECVSLTIFFFVTVSCWTYPWATDI